MIDTGHDLYLAVQKLDLLEKSPQFWWPNAYTFEVLVGAILTQNTQWKRVEESLINLRNNNILSLESLAATEIELLIECIRPSGFFKAKSKNIQTLCQNIISDFSDFYNFQQEVSREWLLSQRGIGPESADAILCYGCERGVMVVDKYTQQLTSALGWEFETYDDLQAWCMEGFVDDHLARELALFHGMIVEYMKRYKKGALVETSPLTSVR
ncbi:MAG: 3-methyladenine DNA glycosylase [Helicobacteraceae bacterium]|jgi:endonuclease-3 related protein|nr:3-methyladenine DNA glycosylase [Helicobacteraceae bacterium]